jgi:hypothetical protein
MHQQQHTFFPSDARSEKCTRKLSGALFQLTVGKAALIIDEGDSGVAGCVQCKQMGSEIERAGRGRYPGYGF